MLENDTNVLVGQRVIDRLFELKSEWANMVSHGDGSSLNEAYERLEKVGKGSGVEITETGSEALSEH